MSEPTFVPDDPRGLTILYGKRYATKQWTWNPTLREWLKKSYDGGKHFTVAEVRAIEGLDDLGACVRSIAANPRAIIIRGALLESERQKTWADPARTVRRLKNKKADAEPVFREIPRQWLMIDIDDFPLRACDDLADDPAAAVEHAVTELLPDCFQDIRAFWQLSSSAGFAPGVLKAHLFYWLTTPVDDATLKKTLRQCAPGITDLSPYQGVQPHYVASPIIKGGPDPIPRRFGWIEGMEDAVVLPALKPDTPRTFSAGGGQAHGRAPALEELGDGEGLSGFHLPLRTATLSHARRCRRFGGRDDAALIETLRAAIRAAPRRPDRVIDHYLDETYLQRQIDGAFQWLDNLPGAAPVPEPPERPVRLPLTDARATLREYVGRFFAALSEREADHGEALAAWRDAAAALTAARRIRGGTHAAHDTAKAARRMATVRWAAARIERISARKALKAALKAARRP